MPENLMKEGVLQISIALKHYRFGRVCTRDNYVHWIKR
jgi:hypothetical protein